jgi:hypothetical protein
MAQTRPTEVLITWDARQRALLTSRSMPRVVFCLRILSMMILME